MSQTKLAREVGTSQSAVARIESGQENITLDTLERFLTSLRGRFEGSIYPIEYAPTRARKWWDQMTYSNGAWRIACVAAMSTESVDKILIGWQRNHVVTTDFLPEAAYISNDLRI